MTALSQSSRFKELRRDNLFFGEFEYRITITRRGIARTRGSNTFDEVLAHVENLKDHINSYKWLISSLPDDEDLLEIEKWFYWRKANPKVKLRLDFNGCSLFSNDPAVLTGLGDLLAPESVQYHRVVGTVPDDVITLLEPKCKYRTYLRAKMLSDSNSQSLREFVERYEHIYFPSDSLLYWTKRLHNTPWTGNRVRETYYFEHNDDSLPLMLSLIVPSLVRKTYKLEPR